MINTFICCGRLTADPQVTTNNDKTIAKFTLAIDRVQNGTDFASFVAFGKTAETVSKYLTKGQKICAEGSFHSDSYEKDGKKIYTSGFWLNGFEFMSKAGSKDSSDQAKSEGFMPIADSLSDEGLPFE